MPSNNPTMKPAASLLPNTGTFSARIANTKPLSPEEFQRERQRRFNEAWQQIEVERAANRQKAAIRAMAAAAIPDAFAGADLRGQAMPGQETAVDALHAMLGAYLGQPPSQAGALLYGPVGAGKSHLACALGNALLQAGRTVLYTTFLDGVIALKNSWRGDAELGEEALMQRYGAVDLLILDEIGIQRGTETEALFLSVIADARARARKPTLCVSNLGPEQVLSLWGERNFDRLLGFGGRVIRVDRPGASLRQRGAP